MTNKTSGTQSVSTRTTDAPRRSLSVNRPVLTAGGQQSSPSPRTVNTGNFTRNLHKQSQNTSADGQNDPRLLADGFRGIVKMLTSAKLLTRGKLADGRLVIILPSTIWNDDITLKG